jgi:hypothetical protein
VSNPRRTWIGIGIIAVVALLIVALPNGGSFVSLVSNTINAVFLVAIAIAGVRLYRSQGEWLSSLTDRNRGIVYGAISISLLAVVAANRFRDLWNGGIVLVILIVAASGAAIYWVWRDSQRWVI